MEEENNFKCDVCHKQFTRNYSLTRHMKDAHKIEKTCEKIYTCDECNTTFTYRSAFFKHKRNHIIEKPHICDVCNKAFKKISNLNCHKKIHTGEKPHICDVCNKAFSKNSDLTRHKRVHSGEKPFKCDVCNKAFSERFVLTEHMRTHTGERPFICVKCGKSFQHRSRVSEHKKKCTGQSSSQQNISASISEFQVLDCGETIKQEIKEESEIGDEINPYDYMSTEFCDNDVKSDKIDIKSELETESIDCKETIKLEIKKEIQEAEDVQYPMLREDPISTDIEEAFVVKLEDNYA